jgi:hypothetical protein
LDGAFQFQVWPIGPGDISMIVDIYRSTPPSHSRVALRFSCHTSHPLAIKAGAGGPGGTLVWLECHGKLSHRVLHGNFGFDMWCSLSPLSVVNQPLLWGPSKYLTISISINVPTIGVYNARLKSVVSFVLVCFVPLQPVFFFVASGFLYQRAV